MSKADSITIDGKKYLLSDLPKEMVVYGDLNLSGLGLEQLPDLSKWVVLGKFDCSNNKLTSLKGSPQIVGSAFICSNNKLQTLKGMPSRIAGYFDCSNNELTSLEGGPKRLTGSYNCSNNHLQTLKGGPTTCLKFICSDNEDLESLKYAPTKLYYGLICDKSLGSIPGNTSFVSFAKQEALLRGEIRADILRIAKQIDKDYVMKKAKSNVTKAFGKTKQKAKEVFYSVVDYIRS